MLKNNNLIKKVKVLSYNETNKKFDAQSVIISNIADATEEYDAINFSCLKKYINTNIEYKINDLLEEVKEIKKIIYNTDIKKENFKIEENFEETLKNIKKNIFEYNTIHKDILNKFLYYEKKNEYILKYIEKLDGNLNYIEKNVLDKHLYDNDKDSLKNIFFSLENKYDDKINSLLLKYDEINVLYTDFKNIIESIKKNDYTQLNTKIKNLENIPGLIDNINNRLESLIEYKKEFDIKLEKSVENDKFNKKNIEENFEELNILKNILKELENKILLFDINIIKNKKDIEFIEQKIQNIINPENKELIEINEEFKNKIHELEKKNLILEKLFFEEKQINTKNHYNYLEKKKSIDEEMNNLKLFNDEMNQKIKQYESLTKSEIEIFKQENNDSIKKIQENFNFIYNENIKNINELKNNFLYLKEVLNKDINNTSKFDELLKDQNFLKDKLQKYSEINKIDINLLNSIIDTLKEDNIKINKIILENNSMLETIKEENKKNYDKINCFTISSVKEFFYDISITNTNNNFFVPGNLNNFFSFTQKQILNKFIKSKLLKIYTKIEFKNSNNILIPINKVYHKENLKIKFSKNNKEIINFEISDFEEMKINGNEINIEFPINLHIKPNNLKECINTDYYIKRNNLKIITIKILGVFINNFQ